MRRRRRRYAWFLTLFAVAACACCWRADSRWTTVGIVIGLSSLELAFVLALQSTGSARGEPAAEDRARELVPTPGSHRRWWLRFTLAALITLGAAALVGEPLQPWLLALGVWLALQVWLLWHLPRDVVPDTEWFGE